MKYDDASWHYGGDFPQGLPNAAGATHMAMFAAWAVLNGLAGDLHAIDFADDLEKLRARSVSPVEWFLRCCDEKLTDEDFCAEGNLFAHDYYGNADGLLTSRGSFIADYCDVFPAAKNLYAVEDGWATYVKLDPIISLRLAVWRNSRSEP
jgi:hypothetical protein